MTTKTSTELQVEMIHWLTSLHPSRVEEVYAVLKPLLEVDQQGDAAIWDDVVETIYAAREASKISTQQRFESLTWEDE